MIAKDSQQNARQNLTEKSTKYNENSQKMTEIPADDDKIFNII